VGADHMAVLEGELGLEALHRDQVLRLA
jgi:hypothetical protein